MDESKSDEFHEETTPPVTSSSVPTLHTTSPPGLAPHAASLPGFAPHAPSLPGITPHAALLPGITPGFSAASTTGFVPRYSLPPGFVQQPAPPPGFGIIHFQNPQSVQTPGLALSPELLPEFATRLLLTPRPILPPGFKPLRLPASQPINPSATKNDSREANQSKPSRPHGFATCHSPVVRLELPPDHKPTV